MLIIIKLIMLTNHPNTLIIARMVDAAKRTCCYDGRGGMPNSWKVREGFAEEGTLLLKSAS